jgi:hypothetical protein
VVNIEQMGKGWSMYPPLMSLVDWYLHKADQCARLAQGTTDRRQSRLSP